MRTMCLSADVTSPRCLISDLTSFIEPSPKLAGIWIVEFLLKLRSRYRRPQKVKWLTNCTGASKVQTVPEKNALNATCWSAACREISLPVVSEDFQD
jgi:hypothetical protein